MEFPVERGDNIFPPYTSGAAEGDGSICKERWHLKFSSSHTHPPPCNNLPLTLSSSPSSHPSCFLCMFLLLPQLPVFTPPVRASLTVGVRRYWVINMLLRSSRVSSVRSKSVHNEVRCYRGMLKWAVVTQQGWGRWKGGIKGLLKCSSMQSRYEVYLQNKMQKRFLKNIQGIIFSDMLLSCSGSLSMGHKWYLWSWEIFSHTCSIVQAMAQSAFDSDRNVLAAVVWIAMKVCDSHNPQRMNPNWLQQSFNSSSTLHLLMRCK